MKKTIIISIIASIIVSAGCKTTDKTVAKLPAKTEFNCSPNAVSYAADIKPIFDQQCINCHGNDGAGGYDLTNFDDIIKAGKNGKLIGTISWQPGFDKMPENGEKLDAVSIAKIECWVNNGMKK